MAGFVDGYGVFLLVGSNLRPLFQSAYDTVHSIYEVLLADGFLVVTRRNQSRFVTYVGNVGA